MPEPLKRIPFAIAGRLAMGDVFRYADPYVFVTHQFGFVRINALTGEYRVRVGIGYNNPIFPPSDIGHYIVGDYNQSVVELAVNQRWIVTDNIAGSDTEGARAVVWRNDEFLTFHGFVQGASGFWWNRGGVPILDGDMVGVPNDRDGMDTFDARMLRWIGHSRIDGSPGASAIRGFTYRWQPLDGSGQSRYELVRSDVAVEQPPAPPPVTEPPPPIVEELPMPTDPPPDVSQPCGPGEYRNLFDGKCYPIGTAPPPGPVPTPVPPLDETVCAFADGITLKLFVHDPRLPLVGVGRVVKLEGGTIAFRFNAGGSLQVFVSVIDGRPVNGHWWVMSCGLTDVDCTLVARKGDAKKEYPNVQGQTFPTRLDTSAFDR